jgi:hypothetical protein
MFPQLLCVQHERKQGRACGLGNIQKVATANLSAGVPTLPMSFVPWRKKTSCLDDDEEGRRSNLPPIHD